MARSEPPAPSTAGYAAEADRLASQYESFSFEALHRPILHLLPAGPARVLDVGAGTGRDAAALAARGYRVTAVEPTAEMRAHGERLHAGQPIQWRDDGLPLLTSFNAENATFDLIFLTAVWMHLDEIERGIAMEAIARLAAPRALIFMTLRHGPVPPGRRMFEVSDEETIALGRRHGLSLHHRDARSGDIMGRAGVDWTRLVLARARA